MGPDPDWVAGLARRYGWHAAEQAALETDRVVRLGRGVRSPERLAAHFARCFARPDMCAGRHRGACGPLRLNLHRARRLDEHQQPHPTNPTPRPDPSPGRDAGVRLPAGPVPAAGTGGAAGGAAVVPEAAWPTDPQRCLAEAAVGAPRPVAALAARLAQRFSHPSTEFDNTNNPERSVPR